STDDFLHDYKKMRVGATLSSAETDLNCIRKKGRRHTLLAADGSPLDESKLQALLGGIDQETFTNRFGLSHDELLAGGKQILSGDGEVGQILFSAGAGISELRRVCKTLDEEASQLFRPRGASTIGDAVKDVGLLKKQIRDSQHTPGDFLALNSQLAELSEQADRCDVDIKNRRAKLLRLRAAGEALPLVPQYESAARHLSDFSDAPVLPETFSERRRDADRSLRVTSERIDVLSQRIKALDSELQRLASDDAVRIREDEIESLYQQLATRETAESDCRSMDRVIANVERKIQTLLRELDVDPTEVEREPDADLLSIAVQQLHISESARGQIDHLAKDHARLVQQLRDAEEEFEAIRRQLQEIDSHDDDSDPDPDPLQLSHVLEELGSPKPVVDHLHDETQIARSLRSQIHDAATALGLADDNHVRATIRKFAFDHFSKRAESWDTANLRLLDLENDSDNIRSQILAASQEQVLVDGESLPTMKDLRSARRQRDRLLDRLSADDLGDDRGKTELAKLRESSRKIDQIVDAIQKYQDQVQRQGILDARIKSLEQRHSQCEIDQQKWRKDRARLEEEWASEWENLGLSPLPMEQWERWQAEFEQLKTLIQRIDDHERTLERLRADIHQDASRLRAALQRAAGTVHAITSPDANESMPLFDSEISDSELGVEDLIAMHDEANTMKVRLQQRHDENAKLIFQRHALGGELPKAEHRLHQRKEALQQWQKDWTAATESLSKDTVSPVEITGVLRTIDQLVERLRERDILRKRQSSIEREHHVFNVSVNHLVESMESHHVAKSSREEDSNDTESRDIAESPETIESSGTSELGETIESKRVAKGSHDKVSLDNVFRHVQRLHGRLQMERVSRESRTRLSKQLDDLRADLAKAEAAHQEAGSTLAALCAEVCCDSADQLPGIEQRAQQRHEYQRTVDEIETRLKYLAGQESLKRFLESLSGIDADSVATEVADLERDLIRLEEQWTDTNRQIGGLQRDRDLIDNSDQAVSLNQDLQSLIGKIEGDASRYAKLHVAGRVLRMAVEHYRKQNQDPVLQHAEEFFQTLTCGEYSNLKAEYDDNDRPVLVGVRHGVDVPATLMSTGTADALYLSLRLASLAHQLRHTQPIPLIVDDCLIQLDDHRSAAALEAFSALSTTTQVILFTHHRHLIDVAKDRLPEGHVHVHALPSAEGRP
ncbi:MAG: AAA family ATPase, partial [Planctomycetota bacterium]